MSIERGFSPIPSSSLQQLVPKNYSQHTAVGSPPSVNSSSMGNISKNSSEQTQQAKKSGAFSSLFKGIAKKLGFSSRQSTQHLQNSVKAGFPQNDGRRDPLVAQGNTAIGIAQKLLESKNSSLMDMSKAKDAAEKSLQALTQQRNMGKSNNDNIVTENRLTSVIYELDKAIEKTKAAAAESPSTPADTPKPSQKRSDHLETTFKRPRAAAESPATPTDTPKPSQKRSDNLGTTFKRPRTAAAAAPKAESSAPTIEDGRKIIRNAEDILKGTSDEISKQIKTATEVFELIKDDDTKTMLKNSLTGFIYEANKKVQG